MGIKNKILLGFIVIAFILLLSSLISIFELGRMRNSVYSLLTDNVSNINTSRQLLEVTDEQVYNLLSQIDVAPDSVIQIHNIYKDPRFERYLNSSKANYNTPKEQVLADTILFAYSAYMQVINDAPRVWKETAGANRRDWYKNILSPNYSRLRHYIEKLIQLEQEYLEKNTIAIQSSFYRSVMPGVISVVAGILLVFLFYYYMQIYLVSPIVKMHMGIKEYLTLKKHYQVVIDSDDELHDLNVDIAKLVEEHRILTKSKQNKE